MMNSNNVFASAARTAANMAVTENGHAAASTTGSALLDLYGQVGALRGQDENRICQLLDLAVAEDRLLATKIMFYARDCRGGTGEREVFRTLLRRMAKIKPAVVVNNLELIPEFGRWDDLYAAIMFRVLFMKRAMESAHISVMRNEMEVHNDGEKDEVLSIPAGTEVYEIEGPFFFGIANKFYESHLTHAHHAAYRNSSRKAFYRDTYKRRNWSIRSFLGRLFRRKSQDQNGAVKGTNKHLEG